MASRAGTCAAENYEPCQVRKEAAVNSMLRVPQGNLVWAGWLDKPKGKKQQLVHDPYFLIEIVSWYISFTEIIILLTLNKEGYNKVRDW